MIFITKEKKLQAGFGLGGYSLANPVLEIYIRSLYTQTHSSVEGLGRLSRKSLNQDFSNVSRFVHQSPARLVKTQIAGSHPTVPESIVWDGT